MYARVSTFDQHPETQLLDLRQMAAQRGYEIVGEYSDTISGAKARRPALDELLADARRRRFDVVMVKSLSDVARSVKQCLAVLDQLNQLGIGFVSCRENIDTTGSMGQGSALIISALSQLQRTLVVEAVKAGMRRSRLEGVRIGRKPLDIDRSAIVQDRISGLSLTTVAQKHRVSRGTVCRLMRLATGIPQPAPTEATLRPPIVTMEDYASRTLRPS
ncbi:MAG: recombinase family protein [Candidatus Sulfotelmatobacter sp.]